MLQRCLLPMLVLAVMLPAALANTNTPFAAGDQVGVTTGTERLLGTLLDSPGPGWIALREAESGQVVLVRLDAVQTLAGPEAPATDTAGATALWKLRSKHFIHGMPVPTDGRYNFTPAGHTSPQPGVSVLIREGFVIGHCDRFKVPLWVSMRWSREDYLRSEAEPSYGRPFRGDQELPSYARAGTSYDFSASSMDRGHMARHADNAAWGKDSSDAGCLMSNIAPQHKDLNRKAWLALEDAHRDAVANEALGIGTIWVISGTVFENTQPQSTVGNGVGVPQATYKVIAWLDDADELHARGYLLTQSDDVQDPRRYLTSIDEIERLTGLDFMPELDEEIENRVESATPTMLWED